jgi:putative transposase
MLVRLSYLTLSSVFTLARLLPMSDTDKDIEILTLRHQLAVLQRQTSKPRLTRADRVLLAALLHRLPPPQAETVTAHRHPGHHHVLAP